MPLGSSSNQTGRPLLSTISGPGAKQRCGKDSKSNKSNKGRRSSHGEEPPFGYRLSTSGPSTTPSVASCGRNMSSLEDIVKEEAMSVGCWRREARHDTDARRGRVHGEVLGHGQPRKNRYRRLRLTRRRAPTRGWRDGVAIDPPAARSSRSAPSSEAPSETGAMNRYPRPQTVRIIDPDRPLSRSSCRAPYTAFGSDVRPTVSDGHSAARSSSFETKRDLFLIRKRRTDSTLGWT